MQEKLIKKDDLMTVNKRIIYGNKESNELQLVIDKNSTVEVPMQEATKKSLCIYLTKFLKFFQKRMLSIFNHVTATGNLEHSIQRNDIIRRYYEFLHILSEYINSFKQGLPTVTNV